MASANELLDLDHVRIDTRVARRIPAGVAQRRQVVLIGENDGVTLAACADPGDPAMQEALERAVDGPVRALAAAPESLSRALDRLFGRSLEDSADETVQTVETLLRTALVEQASDLHFEPFGQGLRVRMRVDGNLETLRTIDAAAAPAVLNRIKVLAGLDIAERRLAQDGSFRWSYLESGKRRSLDVRVACVPTRRGERATLRLLANGADRLTLASLGLEPEDLARLRRAVALPHGMILACGPTGSGKSTTLYGALRELDLERNNLITVEDPVEYELEGASQIEVDSEDRVGFAQALRSLLRHDPDVVMIGEIRDREAADIAIKAALTGHVVLSTLHAQSVLHAPLRLVDIGVPPYLVGATLGLVISQRLVRRLCKHCRVEQELSALQARALGRPEAAGRRAFGPRGCGFCARTGFVGRIGVFELLEIDAELGARIASGGFEERVRERRALEGGGGIEVDALRKVLAGQTSAPEAIAAVESR